VVYNPDHASMPHRDFNDDHTPLGYLITFRTYGTWMHGDERGSMDFHHRRCGTPKLSPSARRKEIETGLLKQPPVNLDKRRRIAVESAIRETCSIRKWNLWKLNIRTNHAHCVITANCDPRIVRNALKANATRAMREAGCWRSDLSPWSRGGSNKYLWTERELVNAIAYVEVDQGAPLD
jgi:REP element-mobilizing transposase RayT